jgi:hypothetical protein
MFVKSDIYIKVFLLSFFEETWSKLLKKSILIESFSVAFAYILIGKYMLYRMVNFKIII